MILHFLFLLLGLLAFAHASAQSCTTTLNPGANVASTASAAAVGSTICLNNGAYGSQSFGAFTKSPSVTVRAVNALGATMSFSISGTNGLVIDGITASGDNSIDNSSSRNITIKNSDFNTRTLQIDTLNFNANNILIDNNYFGKWDATGSDEKEGRLSVTWSGGPGSVSCGVVITNNTFEGGSPGGCSDGIQVGSYGVVIGPGNTFKDLQQGSCGPHVDAIQGFGQSHTTINGNYFVNNSVSIGMYDGGDTETITNNVFIESLGSITGGTPNLTFSHNTLSGSAQADFTSKTETGPTTATARNNLFVNGASFKLSSGGQLSCSGCTIDNNQFSTSGQGAGTNQLIGVPTFVGGGSAPSTWAGWQLTAGSVGHNAGTDGQDMGTTFYGTATGPAAPANFRLIYTFPPLNHLAWRHHHGIPK